ncbi:hypothetical protein CROQUDRAFT_451546 [Cronartium quercuum f. sp. fusiforme G11]|uniref:C2H2-type domain-containing protein n=1 Tax=Cronartium quercuum f. sp. fusiforme G11 TaxID=708437 RepID=A0A9P6NKQ4_9BASI|nr:hypothetical protein CROQUDRAFT_451546 [Cronartium quercuum f. sp. fusiforme G11]
MSHQPPPPHSPPPPPPHSQQQQQHQQQHQQQSQLQLQQPPHQLQLQQHQIIYFPSIAQTHPTPSVLPQTSSSSSIKPPKPPAQCSYCGMTFKKLEHCQRHERTHTLARPYACTVCLKTFARQDTLNRHLRLHSRPDDGTAPRPKKRPSRPSVSVSSSSGPDLFPPITTTSLLNPQLAQASDQAHDRTRPGRERGFSLSAVEQHSTLEPYSMPILSAQQQLLGPATHQNWNSTHPPVTDPIPPELTLNSSPLLNNLSLGPLTPLDSSLLAGLNAYTLTDVSASDNQPPMSAPATCTS